MANRQDVSCVRTLAAIALGLFGLGPAADAALIRGPYLQRAGPTSIVVRWRTDTVESSLVRFGLSPGKLEQTVNKPELTTEHEIRVFGLPSGVRHYYSIGSDSDVLAGGDFDHFFTTPPPPGTVQETRVWVLGDSGTADAKARMVGNAYLTFTGSRGTDLMIMLGDNAYPDGTDSEYQAAVFDVYGSALRNTVLWPAMGNHDGTSADSSTETGPYYEIFTLPKLGEAGGLASSTEAYYAYDHANIHFVVLDSFESATGSGSAMMTWLAADLASTLRDWIIVYWHHAPYSKGGNDSDNEPWMEGMREDVVEIVENHGADLVLAGHSHSYERSFLIDGHYGPSNTFDPEMLVDAGSGREDGDGAYAKTAGTHNGAVYIVAGSSGKIDGDDGSLDHPAMFVSLNELGSVVLDIDGNRLNAAFLRHDGKVTDHFTLLKGPDDDPPRIKSARGTNAMTVRVEFNEAVDPFSAENADLYSIDGGVTVFASALLGDPRVVELTTSLLTESAIYTVSVSGITDPAGNAVAPGEQALFKWSEPFSIAFQQGNEPTSSYAGARDAHVWEASADTNYGDDVALRMDGVSGGGEKDFVTLVRWDVSEIPPGSTVLAATLDFDVDTPSSGAYEIFELLSPWVEDEATWNLAASGDPWQIAGALGPADRSPLIRGSLYSTKLGNVETSLYSAGLDTVQRWLDDPSANHGVIIANTILEDDLVVDSREVGSKSKRPRLSIEYTFPPCAPTAEVQGVTVSRTGTAVEICWNPGTDACVESFRLLGASVPQSDAGFQVLRQSTGLTDCTTLHTDESYFLVIGQDAEPGPWGHYGR